VNFPMDPPPKSMPSKTHLEQRENLLGEVVVKVRVLGAAHVVDEDEASALRLRVLERAVQLIDDALQSTKTRAKENAFWTLSHSPALPLPLLSTSIPISL